MRITKDILRLLTIMVAALTLTLAGCSDDESTPSDDDTGSDTGGDTGGGDMLVDTGGGDMLVDTGADMMVPTDLCVADAAALTADEGLLAGQVGSIVSTCIFGPCLSCALAGANCGDGGTIESCMTDCITGNDFGDCATGGSSSETTCDDDDGYTCDDVNDVCSNDAGTAVNQAIGAGDLSVDCVGCFIALTACGAAECSTPCLADDCQCDSCRCDEGCEDAFAVCTGVPLGLDCSATPEDASMCLDEAGDPNGTCSDSTITSCGGTPTGM